MCIRRTGHTRRPPLLHLSRFPLTHIHILYAFIQFLVINRLRLSLDNTGGLLLPMSGGSGLFRPLRRLGPLGILPGPRIAVRTASLTFAVSAELLG